MLQKEQLGTEVVVESNFQIQLDINRSEIELEDTWRKRKCDRNDISAFPNS